MARSWKHMNYSQFKLAKGKEEEGMARKHIKMMLSTAREKPQEGGRGAA